MKIQVATYLPPPGVLAPRPQMGRYGDQMQTWTYPAHHPPGDGPWRDVTAEVTRLATQVRAAA